MDKVEILKPLVLQVFLVLSVMLYMFHTRFALINKKKIKPQQLSSSGAQKEQLLKEASGPSDNFINLFEVPILFYLAIFTIYLTEQQDSFYLGLSYIFVLFRAIHSLIQCSYNKVMHRFGAYVVSSFAVVGIWLRLGLTVLAQ